jgi:MFS family permease
VWLARLPSIRDDLDMSIGEVGVLSFALPAGSLIGLALASPLLLAFGTRRSLVAGMTGIAAGVSVIGIGSSMLHSFTVAFVALLFTGVMLGVTDVVMNVEGAAAERTLGRSLLPRLHAGFTLGAVLAALGGALTSYAGWSVAAFFVPAGLFIFIIAVSAKRWIPRRTEFPREDGADDVSATRAATWGARFRTFLSVWRDPKLLLIGVSLFAFAFSEGMGNDWLAIASVDGLRLDNTGGAIMLGLFVAVLTVARFFGGPVLDRFGRVLTLRVGVLLTIGGIVLFVFGGHPAWAATGIVLWALGVTFGFPVSISAAAEGPNAAQRVSAASLIGYSALLAGPPVLGLLAEHIGILTALLPAVGLLVVAFFTIPAMRERTRAPLEPESARPGTQR